MDLLAQLVTVAKAVVLTQVDSQMLADPLRECLLGVHSALAFEKLVKDLESGGLEIGRTQLEGHVESGNLSEGKHKRVIHVEERHRIPLVRETLLTLVVIEAVVRE